MEQIDKLAKEKIEELLEVKSYDKAHGRKLSKNILSKFFKNVAPNLKSLDDVKHNLAKIYSQNNIEYDNRVISSIISRYAKKVKLSQERDPTKKQVTEEVQIQEVALTQAQQRKKEEVVKAMKKHIKELKKKYGSGYEQVLYATATQIAKRDTFTGTDD